MAVHLVRHARAGARPAWGQPDELRPLTADGERQARAIADVLADAGVERVLSSRFARCVQTVAPLAERLGLEVEHHPALSEEADLDDTWALIEELAVSNVVACSHGNIIPPLLDRLRWRGATLMGDDHSCRKGSVWTLETDGDGTIVRAVQTKP